MSPKRLLLLTAMITVAAVPLACDFPTESDEESQVPTTQAVTLPSAAGTVSNLSLTPPTSKLQIGETMTFQYSVSYNRADASEPLPTQLGLTVNLGNFGTAADGPTTATPALSFSCTAQADGSENCTASGQQAYYSGTTTGTASVIASLASSTQTATVTVAQATPLFINSLSPTFGPASGGTQVTISGQGFTTSPQPRVTFGSVLAQFVSSTSTSVVVNAPQSPSPVSTGSTLVVDVKVDVPATDVTDAQTDTLSGAFTYTAGGGAAPRIPTIQRIQASSTGTNAGDNAGGYTVTIFGSNFEDPLVVKIGSGTSVSDFNGVTVTATRVNGGQITIPSMPPASPSQLNTSVDILVQNQGSGLGTVAQSGFSYQSPDVVVDAEPSSATYYLAASTQVTVKVRGLDVTGSSGTLDTGRYTLEFGGETQCGTGLTCGLSGPDSSGTFTLTVPQTGGIVPVTPSSCSDQSGAVTLTDRVTTETASGSTFSYNVETPTISGLEGSNGSCSTPPCDFASGGSMLTITGMFSPTELSSAQVLINGSSALFSQSGCQDAPNLTTCTLTATVPAFTGSFDTAACTSSGETGTQDQPKKVDVEVLYQSTTCNITRSQAFTYDPPDDSCVVTTTAPTANFTSQVNTTEPLMVQFIDQSTGASTIEWFLGDGSDSQSCTSDELPCDITYTYDTAGLYTVSQRATNSAGSNSLNQTVLVGEEPSAAISVATTATVGTELVFVNSSTGIDSGTTCEWDWGDGTTPDLSCGTERPLQVGHTFTSAGTFTVLLRVTNGLGTDSESVEIVVSAAR